MPDSATPTYGFILPEVGGSDDTWGEKLNDNWSQLDDLLTSILQTTLYPVGSLFMTTLNLDPNTILGFGEWSPYAVGRAIVGVGEADSVDWTGGEEKGVANHVLTEAQLPAHEHGAGSYGTSNVGSHSHNLNNGNISSSGNHTHSSGNLSNNDSGGSHSHNIGFGFTWVNKGTSGTVYRALARNSGEGSESGTIDKNTDNMNIGHSHGLVGNTAGDGVHSHNLNGATSDAGAHSHNVTGSSASTGSDEAHPNIQPSVGVYIWQRQPDP